MVRAAAWSEKIAMLSTLFVLFVLFSGNFGL